MLVTFEGQGSYKALSCYRGLEVAKVDPETAILYTVLLAETPSVPAESLPPLAQLVEEKMFVNASSCFIKGNGSREVNSRTVADTPEVAVAFRTSLFSA